MEEELDETVQIEEIVMVKPKGFNYHLIYSVLPFIVIIGSLFIGKVVVDYLSRDEAPDNKVVVDITPSPTPTIASPTITETSPTPQPTVRPEDPLVGESQRRYTNGNAGISLLYPKDWSVSGEQSVLIDDKIPSFNMQLDLGAVNVAYITYNPYELYWGPEKKTEKITVSGREGELLVTGFCTEEEKKNAALCDGDNGAIVVKLIGKENDKWFFIMYMKNQSEIDVTIQKMKDLVSTVKFL